MNKGLVFIILIFNLLIINTSLILADMSEDIPLGKAIGNDTTFAFDWKLDDSDIQGLQDLKIDFQGDEIDIRDILVIVNPSGSSPSVETSLSSSDDDYEDGVFMEAERASLKYFYHFDDVINVSKATPSDSLNINFLGKNISITQVINPTTIMINYDGVSETVNDGDPYINQDSSNPDWVWNIGNLHKRATTGLVNRTSNPGGPFIGVENDFVKNDDSDDPAGIGECYDLPNNYVSACLDSLDVDDNNYLPLTVEYKEGVDTAKSRHPNGSTLAKTIYISASGEDRFIIKTGGWRYNYYSPWPYTEIGEVNSSNTVSNAETSEIWLQHINGVRLENGTAVPNATLIFFKDDDQTPSMVYAGLIYGIVEVTIAQLDFGNTENTNLQLRYLKSIGEHQIRLNFTGDSSSELQDGQNYYTINFSKSNGAFNALGATKSQEEANELVWYSSGVNGKPAISTGIGTRNENLRGLYGEIIKDPNNNGASDQVVVLVPSDQVQANVVIRHGCLPNWECIGYGLCVGNLQNCNSVEDTNNCGLEYNGDYSEFNARVCPSLNGSLLEQIQNNITLILNTLNGHTNILTEHNNRILLLEEKQENLQSRTDELENDTNNMLSILIDHSNILNSYDDRITNLENNQNNGSSFPNYFKYLGSNDRKKMVCGYAEDNNMTFIEDLGYSCNLTYKYSSSGRLNVKCKCEKI